jgi:hypothetical protein
MKDLYVNIPIKYTLNITKQMLKENNTDTATTKEIANILRIILNHNYF